MMSGASWLSCTGLSVPTGQIRWLTVGNAHHGIRGNIDGHSVAFRMEALRFPPLGFSEQMLSEPNSPEFGAWRRPAARILAKLATTARDTMSFRSCRQMSPPVAPEKMLRRHCPQLAAVGRLQRVSHADVSVSRPRLVRNSS